MKKLYALIAIAVLSVTAYAQTTIYSENMGTSTATAAITANTFQNGAPITYSGSGDVRSSNPSSTTNYPTASGGANVMINATNETFIISGIDTSNYTGLVLSFGQRKGTTAGNNELKVEVSPDGTTWIPLSYSRPTGTGTATWAYITPTGTIPSTPSLSIRFTGTNGTEWRIDDMLLTASGTLAVIDAKDKKINLVKSTVVDSSLDFGVKADVKIYDMNGRMVKAASVNEGSSVDVSSLAKGVYIVAGEVEGQKVTQKIIKK